MTSDNYRVRHRASQDSYDYDYPDERVRQNTYKPSTVPADSTSSTRARAQSRSSDAPQSQHLKDAVNSNLDISDSMGQVSPDLVAHITEQVLNNLKLNGIGTSVPPVFVQPIPQSARHNTIPPRNVYTPPSPEQHASAFASSGSSDDLDTRMGGGYDGTNDKETSPRRSGKIPASTSSAPSKAENPMRPKVVERTSTGNTASTLEKIWQPLFDGDGSPTARLGQFLRGVAIHIIEDFEPQQSLVVTPSKMSLFYEKVRLTDEVYPWSDIFGAKMTNSSLSHLYRDLGCEHHFVQTKFHERPTVPSLTPHGFERWMTFVIQANPDIEFERFSKAVLYMPISNADNKQERFPKQLSRRLFPQSANAKVKMELDDAILTDPVIKLCKVPSAGQASAEASKGSSTGSGNIPPPPKMPPPATEGERRGPNVAFNETATDDTPPAVAIERERKPYTSQPGAGKTYESDETRGSRADGPSWSTNSTSTATGARSGADKGDGYRERSQYRHHRTGSQVDGPPPTMRRRQGSPPGGYKDYDVGGPSGYGVESDEENWRYERERERERSRRYADEKSGASAKDEGLNHRRGSVQGGYVYPPPPR